MAGGGVDKFTINQQFCRGDAGIRMGDDESRSWSLRAGLLLSFYLPLLAVFNVLFFTLFQQTNKEHFWHQ